MAGRPLRCVIHIGFGKTGSSALQAYCSRYPDLRAAGGHRYLVIDDGGQVLDGETLRTRLAGSPRPFLASSPRLWERADLETVGGRLAAAAPADAARMRRDPRWWSSEPYRDRRPPTADELRATPQDLGAAIAAMLTALKS